MIGFVTDTRDGPVSCHSPPLSFQIWMHHPEELGCRKPFRGNGDEEKQEKDVEEEEEEEEEKEVEIS